MSGLLDALIANKDQTVERVQPLAGNDPQKAEQAFDAAIAAMLRGMEQQAQSKEGAESLWDLIKRQANEGNISSEAPSPKPGVQVRDMDPKTVNDILSSIFGKDAPQVEKGFGKVITLDPETSRQIFSKILPPLLGAIFGTTEKAPQSNVEALPDILGGARKEIENRQPKVANIFQAIFDKDHDGDVDLNDLVGILSGR
jgi:hypothetical protein